MIDEDEEYMKTQYIRLPHLIAELHAEWKNARQAYAKAEIPARAANRPKGSCARPCKR